MQQKDKHTLRCVYLYAEQLLSSLLNLLLTYCSGLLTVSTTKWRDSLIKTWLFIKNITTAAKSLKQKSIWHPFLQWFRVKKQQGFEWFFCTFHPLYCTYHTARLMSAILWLLPCHALKGSSASKAAWIDWPDYGDIKKKLQFALVVHNVARTLEEFTTSLCTNGNTLFYMLLMLQ